MRRVVVTGLGVVSPIGTGVRSFFGGLAEGRSGVDTIGRFDASSFPTRIAAEVRDLEPDPIGLADRWSVLLGRDPKAWYGVVAAREAISSAFGGSDVAEFHEPRRVGIFCAAGLEIFSLEALVSAVGPSGLKGREIWEAVHTAAPAGGLQIPADVGARIIAEESAAQGPLSVNVSACAAGTQALGEAFHAIGDGMVDCAIAGGYDSMVNPLGVGGFSMLEALSRSNDLRGKASRPFDARRDGFVLGEGAGFCVLEERKAALARGGRVWAEVLGYASTLDAYRVSDPAPDQSGATACMKNALHDARLNPDQIEYINAHGTGTRKNDPAESAAIRSVFGTAADRIPVSSTKSQIGHLIGAAGAVEFLALLFALTEDLLPPTINLDQPDPACDLDYVPNRARPARVDKALSNSFGFGGQNATIVVGSP